MIAICQIRDEPHYRKDAFLTGLRNAGYTVVSGGKPENKRDLLVIWNRYGAQEGMADTWERAGGTVLVCENGYLGKDNQGRQFYSIAATGHNGSGWWPVGDETRLDKLAVSFQPWQCNDDGHLLICGQRGIGTKLMASPNNWHNAVAARLRKQTDHPIKIRLHPGNKPALTPLDDDLRGAYACVVWSSTSGVKALVQGIPVYYDAPHWICEDAALRVDKVGYGALVDDRSRLKAFQRMAWAQWSVDEIGSGEPFVWFISEINWRAVKC